MNVVITDRRAVATPGLGASTWEAVVVSTADYYPFVMLKPSGLKEGALRNGTSTDSNPSVSMIADISMFRANSTFGCQVNNLKIGKLKTYVSYANNQYIGFLQTDGYRYAYNGMEKDNEVSGNGNSYTTEFRQYDPRLGRWKSLDPLMAKFPWMSPYVAFDNNPVLYTDPYGLEGESSNNGPGKKLFRKIPKQRVSWGNRDKYRRGHTRANKTDKPVREWRGLTNIGRWNNPQGSPEGHMVDGGWSDTVRATIMSSGGDDARSVAINVRANKATRENHGRVTMTALKVDGVAPPGTLIRATSGRSLADQKGINASSAAQLLGLNSHMWLLGSESGTPRGTFGIRTGGIPGLNFTPSLALYLRNRYPANNFVQIATFLGYQLWYEGFLFNHTAFRAGRNLSMTKITAYSVSKAVPINLTYSYRFSQWQRWAITGKNKLVSFWHFFLYGTI